jgi:pyruvyl transferase EpsI
MLVWGALRLLIVVVFVGAGLRWGPMGVAVALSFSSVCIRFPVVAWMVGRKGPVHARHLYEAMAPSFIASIGALAVLGAYRYLAAPENPLIGIGVSFGLVVGVTALVLLFMPAGRAALLDAIEMAAPVVGRESGEMLQWLKTPGRPFQRLAQNLRYYGKRRSLRLRRKFLYALTPPPNLQNVGDHAQAVAIRRWLAKHFPNTPVIEVNRDETRYYLRALRRLIQPDDVIFIQSGGDLGDLSLRLEKLRRMLIAKFPWNRIISLPQTIQFTDTPRGMREKQKTAETYNRHPDLTILTRDPESESIARAMFDKARVLCIPDFMLSLPPREPTPQNDPARVLLCLREDDQTALTPNELQAMQERLPYPSGFANTYVDRLIPREQQESVLEETLDLFSSYDVIVTDRLHGLIFGILCRKACVVLPTLDHKLTAAMTWFRDMPQVVLAEASENVPECVVRLLALDERHLPDWNDAYFDRLPEQLGLHDG